MNLVFWFIKKVFISKVSSSQKKLTEIFSKSMGPFWQTDTNMHNTLKTYFVVMLSLLTALMALLVSLTLVVFRTSAFFSSRNEQ